MIEIPDINKTHDTGNRALRDVNITVGDGEFVFIMGQSGSGKPTLLRLLLEEVEPNSGKIIVSDMRLGKVPRHHVSKYHRKLGTMFQDFRLLKDRDAYENVALALRTIDAPTRVIKESVSAMLHMVGLLSKYKSFPQQLPDGEQQRVAIAGTLISNPEVFLTGEPTGNLDNHNAIEITKLLEKINQQGTTVVVVVHSRGIIDRIQKWVITMDRGVVIGDEKKGGYTHED